MEWKGGKTSLTWHHLGTKRTERTAKSSVLRGPLLSWTTKPSMSFFVSPLLSVFTSPLSLVLYKFPWLFFFFFSFFNFIFQRGKRNGNIPVFDPPVYLTNNTIWAQLLNPPKSYAEILVRFTNWIILIYFSAYLELVQNLL